MGLKNAAEFQFLQADLTHCAMLTRLSATLYKGCLTHHTERQGSHESLVDLLTKSSFIACQLSDPMFGASVFYDY